MRPTRVIYVENDPALRGIMAKVLATRSELEIVLSAGSADEALSAHQVRTADVALLDLGLGPNAMNGVELGIALQDLNANIGIVLHSQHPLEFALERVPIAQRNSWATLQKSADLDIAELVRLLRHVAAGRVVNAPVAATVESENTTALDRLSERQRTVMALAASGYSATQIAERLSLSYAAVRQAMSRAYRVLVPDDASGEDLRTQAVMEYTRLARNSKWEVE